MPDAHAILAPSASHRWLSCPASVLLSQQTGRREVTSAAASEGTWAHELAEARASLAFGKIGESTFQTWLEDWHHRSGITGPDFEEMDGHLHGYITLIEERRTVHPMSQLQLEQSLPSGIDGCWGTSDAVIVSPVHVEVIDLKYGRGIPVSAVDNPQLRLYGLGALDTFGDVLGETETVTLTVYQPRNGGITTETLPAAELRRWRERIRPVAAEALQPGARFGPNEEACRFCPVAGECRARLEYATALDFGHPDLLSAEELGQALDRLFFIRSWCDAVADTALRKIYSEGTPIPGWKVVMSGGRRSITDHNAALNLLLDQGYAVDQVARLTAKPLGDLERLVGRGGLEPILGDLLVKPEGKPALAPQDDPRDSVSPDTEAIKEFSE